LAVQTAAVTASSAASALSASGGAAAQRTDSSARLPVIGGVIGLVGLIVAIAVFAVCRRSRSGSYDIGEAPFGASSEMVSDLSLGTLNLISQYQEADPLDCDGDGGVERDHFADIFAEGW
jgi:hypothetical protein